MSYNIQYEVKVLHHWNRIEQLNKRVQDLYLQIAKLKDEILEEEVKLTNLQEQHEKERDDLQARNRGS